jgi:predicted dehydrogenase
MLRFPDGRVAHIHVSWLDPYKIRRLTLVGTRKMLAFDDMQAAEKVRLYDKGAQLRPETTSYAEAVQVRSGDVRIPKVDLSEPLQRECRRFISAVREDGPVLSDGWDGLEVVRILEAGSESLRQGGVAIAVPGLDAPAFTDPARPAESPVPVGASPE